MIACVQPMAHVGNSKRSSDERSDIRVWLPHIAEPVAGRAVARPGGYCAVQLYPFFGSQP
jgi:hypothetical protein